MKFTMMPVAAVLAALATPILSNETDFLRLAQAPATLPSSGPPSSGPTAVDAEVEVAFWRSVVESDDPRLYLAYLEQYPDGAFRVIARNRLEELWDRALRAFALLDELGVSLDGRSATSPQAGAAANVSTRSSVPRVVTPPVVIPKPPSGAEPRPSRKLVRNTQMQLKKHGCYLGAIDGDWGVGSRAAMRRYNRLSGNHFPVSRPTSSAIKDMRELTRMGVKICR